MYSLLEASVIEAERRELLKQQIISQQLALSQQLQQSAQLAQTQQQLHQQSIISSNIASSSSSSQPLSSITSTVSTMHNQQPPQQQPQIPQAALAPISPTSLSPFLFSSSHPQQPSQASGTTTPRGGPTEVYNEEQLALCLLLQEQQAQAQQQPILAPSACYIDHSKQGGGTIRRHTLGPEQTPQMMGHHQPAVGAHFHHGGAGAHNNHLLPQTNLNVNLPLVSNLPPESFSIKDPHLLRPPLALGVLQSQIGRRASDGGSYFGYSAEAPASLPAATSTPNQQERKNPTLSLQSSGDENYSSSTGGYSMHSSEAGDTTALHTPLSTEPGSSRPGSPNPMMVEQYLSHRGHKQRHTVATSTGLSGSGTSASNQSNLAPESPRKRRTGLDTVLEKPQLSPEVVAEAEDRMLHHQFQPLHPPHSPMTVLATNFDSNVSVSPPSVKVRTRSRFHE